jgi:signal transduction histidine kinase
MRHVPDVIESAQEPVVEQRLVDLDALVARLVEMHRGYAKEREASISAALPAAPIRLRSDDQRIAQVLSNLIRNGIEASREHSVRVEVLGGAFRDGREGVLLSISDTGPGMPRDVLERIGSPQRSNKGGDHAGLGLLIVHRLVGELSGSMDIRTAPGLGTTITIFLPLSP